MSVSEQETVREHSNGGGRHFRRSLFRRPLLTRLTAALTVSLLFHLSMITVFQIVIALPSDPVEYYEVRLVSSPEEPARTSDAAAAARGPDTLALSGAALYDPLPAVALPIVEFAELERLRIRYDASAPLTGMGRFLEDTAPTDSWARFGGELQRLGRTLREIALPGQETGAARAGEAQQYLTHRPAEGFEAYIEWSGPPRDRELLFSPPIRALWNLNPAEVTRPFEIVFKVDTAGRVVNVWSPMLDDSGVIDDVQMTVLQYRFAPLARYDAAGRPLEEPVPASEQSGVLFIRAAGGRP